MKIHMVKKGDSLYLIAQKYNVSLEELLQANPEIANPDVIDVGMKIKIPMPAQPAYEVMHQHKVQQGDTLWKLSKAWGIPLETMIKANPQLKNPNVLLTGEIVNIPKIGQGDQGTAATPNANPAPGVGGTGVGGWPSGKANTGVMPGAASDMGEGQVAGAATSPGTAPMPGTGMKPGTGVKPGTGIKPGTGVKPETEVMPQPEPMPMPMPMPMPETNVSPEATAPAPVMPAMPEVKIEYEHIDLFKQYPMPAVEAVAPVHEEPCPDNSALGGQHYGYGGYGYAQPYPANVGPEAVSPFGGYGQMNPAAMPGYADHGYGYAPMAAESTANAAPGAVQGIEGLPYPVFPTPEMAKAYAMQQLGQPGMGEWSGMPDAGYGHGGYFPGNNPSEVSPASMGNPVNASPGVVSPESTSPAMNWPQSGPCHPCMGTPMWPAMGVSPAMEAPAGANMPPYPAMNAVSPLSVGPEGAYPYGTAPMAVHDYGHGYGYGAMPQGMAPTAVSPFGSMPAGNMPPQAVSPWMTNAGPAMTNAGPATTNVGPAMMNVGPAMTNVGPAMANSVPGMMPAYPGLYPYAGGYPHAEALGGVAPMSMMPGAVAAEEDCRNDEDSAGAEEAGISAAKKSGAQRPALKAKIKSKPAPKPKRKQSLPWVNW